MDAETSVRVAVRIRPISGKEKLERCSECCKPLSNEELVMMGKDRRFTFDCVFGTDSEQVGIYDRCVSSLVENFFAGYNATVFAYGQTGSGKTYTMGSSSEGLLNDEDKLGIIPRAMQHVFEMIHDSKLNSPNSEFYLRVQFLELYGEEIRDLLDPAGVAAGKQVSIRECEKGESGIQIVGASEETVTSTEDMLDALERGTMCRTTASTQMNVHSSRSHAIFTIVLEQHLPLELDAADVAGQGDAGDSPAQEIEYRTAKFHFVDLAGSERAKRTGATGTRLREGININKGLLALGNVISALGDENKRSLKNLHVPYRDSKLTRMLQDSLGGNSRTLMITCVSPADSNYEETLNALRYANRARNIKNKPVVNRDPASSQIAFLKQQVAQLKMQLMNGGIVPDLQSGSQFSTITGKMTSDISHMGHLENELSRAMERTQNAEDEVKRLGQVLEKEKRARSDLQEKYILCVAEVDYYKAEFGDAMGAQDGDDPATAQPSTEEAATTGDQHATTSEEETSPTDSEGGTAKQRSAAAPGRKMSKMDHIHANAEYVKKIEMLQNQLKDSDDQLMAYRRQLENAQNGHMIPGVRGSNSSAMNFAMEPTSGQQQLPDDFVDHVLEVIETDHELVELAEDDDEQTKLLKEKFHQNQEQLRESVKRYDVELKSKMMLMERIKAERLKYEAMKAQYEKKMVEMNAEVRDTQTQRDDLDTKIRELERQKETEASKSQVNKMRAQLKAKNDRLKELEGRAKELELVRRTLEKKRRAEQDIQREIETIKRQKVEYQRRMEEASKKYREETKRRMKEIAQLKKQSRTAETAKSQLAMKNARATSMLKAKTEQVAALQRKVREQQRYGRNKKQLTEQDKRHRRLLEKWTQDRIQREEEFERLQRALSKKQAAVERAERLLKELEETKRAAELRATAAEEAAVKAHIDLQQQKKRNQRQKQQQQAKAAEPHNDEQRDEEVDRLTSSKKANNMETETTVAAANKTASDGEGEPAKGSAPLKTDLRQIWKGASTATATATSSVAPAGSDGESATAPQDDSDKHALAAKSGAGGTESLEMTAEYNEAIEELESRLEAAESEIQFQDQQYQAAIKKFNKTDDVTAETGGDAVVGHGDEDDEMKIPFQFRTLDEASTVFKQVIQMYIESKKEKMELSEKLERLRSPSPSRRNSLRNGTLRRNTLLNPQGVHHVNTSTGRSAFRGRYSADGALKSGATRGSSPRSVKRMSGAGVGVLTGGNGDLNEKLQESHELVQELIQENKKLKSYLMEKSEMSPKEIDELLAGCRVDFLEERIRQMQALSIGSAGAVSAFSPRSTTARTSSSRGRKASYPPRVRLSSGSRTGSPEMKLRKSRRSNSPASLNGRQLTYSPSTSPVPMEHHGTTTPPPIVGGKEAGRRANAQVFERLYDPKNFTGVHKRKAYENKLLTRETTVDSLTLRPTETTVDTFHNPNLTLVEGSTEVECDQWPPPAPPAESSSPGGVDAGSDQLHAAGRGPRNGKGGGAKPRAGGGGSSKAAFYPAGTTSSSGSLSRTDSGHTEYVDIGNKTYKTEEPGLFRAGQPSSKRAGNNPSQDVSAECSDGEDGEEGGVTKVPATQQRCYLYPSGDDGFDGPDRTEKGKENEQVLVGGGAEPHVSVFDRLHDTMTGTQRQKSEERKQKEKERQEKLLVSMAEERRKRRAKQRQAALEQQQS